MNAGVGGGGGWGRKGTGTSDRSLHRGVVLHGGTGGTRGLLQVVRHRGQGRVYVAVRGLALCRSHTAGEGDGGRGKGLQLRLELGNVVTREGERGESGSWRLDG